MTVAVSILLFGHLATMAQQAVASGTPPDWVEIVLFSDFQCPFCAQIAQPIRELQTNGVDGVRATIRFKHFPLSIHPNAQLAHQAAVAAGEQGKFWEMHDLHAIGRCRRSDRLLRHRREMAKQ